MKIKLLLLLSGAAMMQSFAQKTENIADINSKGSAFPFGSKVFQGEKLCFQAYDRNGNTALYYLNESGAQVIQKWDLTDHSVFVNPVISQKGSVLFGVLNDSLNAGIWIWKGENKAKLVYPGGMLNENFVLFQDKIYVNAQIPDKKGFVFSFDGTGNLQKEHAFDHVVENLAVERMINWKGNLLMNYRERFYLYDGSSLKIYEPAGAGQDLSEPFLFDNKLYFTASGKSKKRKLMSLSQDEKLNEVSSTAPNINSMDAFAPLVGDDKVYFLSNADKKGSSIYSMTSGGTPERIETKFYQETSSRFSSYCVNKDGLFFCTKPDDRSEYSVWQYAMDTLIPYQLESARNPICIAPWGQDILMIAKHDDYDIEPLKVSTFQFPSVKFADVVMMENTPRGRKVGQIEVDKKNSKRLKYDIVGGNIGDAFTIDPYDGSIYVKNTDSLNARLHPTMDLEVKVITSCFKPVIKVPVSLLVAKPLDMNNLQEKFLFYPDFDRKGYLMTNVLEDGEHIKVFSEQLKMIDELVVNKKCILISGYPAGFYILNAQNRQRNYFQKIEIK